MTFSQGLRWSSWGPCRLKGAIRPWSAGNSVPTASSAWLGIGGMGEVYRAHDSTLDRDVAIKVLKHDVGGDPDRKRRFVQEARTASALNHPNIVTIDDINQEDGRDFIVMEYVDGQSLDHTIPDGGLEIERALEYAVCIASAIEALTRPASCTATSSRATSSCPRPAT